MKRRKREGNQEGGGRGGSGKENEVAFRMEVRFGLDNESIMAFVCGGVVSTFRGGMYQMLVV